jgi:predicted nucleic acid-binding protein
MITNKLFLDTNVILDCLLERGDYINWKKILIESEICYVNNVVIATCSYIIEKSGLDLEVLFQFLDSTVVISTGIEDFELAIELFELHNDFEDCLIVANCINNGVNCIATGDQKLIKNISSKIEFVVS